MGETSTKSRRGQLGDSTHVLACTLSALLLGQCQCQCQLTTDRQTGRVGISRELAASTRIRLAVGERDTHAETERGRETDGMKCAVRLKFGTAGEEEGLMRWSQGTYRIVSYVSCRVVYTTCSTLEETDSVRNQADWTSKSLTHQGSGVVNPLRCLLYVVYVPSFALLPIAQGGLIKMQISVTVVCSMYSAVSELRKSVEGNKKKKRKDKVGRRRHRHRHSRATAETKLATRWVLKMA